MKKSLKAKSSVGKTKVYETAGKLVNLLQLKKRLRHSLSALLIAAMLLTTLFIDLEMFKSWAQFDCNDPDKIFQSCSLGSTQGGRDLTNQAIDDVLQFYKLPSSERANVMKYARSEVRGMLFRRLLALVEKTNRSADENAVLTEFAEQIKTHRLRAATAARDEYTRWTQNACGNYQPPPGFTYHSSGCTIYTLLWNGSPVSPTFEEFQQFGAAIAYQGLYTPEGKAVSERTSKQIGLAAGAVAGQLAGAVGVVIGTNLTIATLSLIKPFIAFSPLVGGSGGAPVAATTASGAVGGASVGGAAAVFVAAAIIIATQTLNVVNQAAIPDKLNQAITDVQNSSINIPALISTDLGRMEFYSVFLLETLPDFPGTDVPAQTPQDRQFVVRQQNAGTASDSYTIQFLSSGNQTHTARLSGNWIVERVGSVEKQVLSINYVDWNGRRRSASRFGAQFMTFDPLNPNDNVVTDELQFTGANGIKYAAKFKFSNMTVLSRETIQTGCVFANPQNGTTEFIATIANAGEPASSLTATVNGAASATVNNIIVRNLTIDSDYNVRANVVNRDAAAPVISEFTLAVRNSLGQTVSTVFKIRKTGIASWLPADIPGEAQVGTPYQAFIAGMLELGCGGVSGETTYTITGDLPLGLKIERDPNTISSILFLRGTPQSGGYYIFTITKTSPNGESTSQVYDLLVRSEITKLDDSAVAWWRGEGNPSDHFNRADGTITGSVGYDVGRVGFGFKFDGSSSYVSLPRRAFVPYDDFTFETWFKTAEKGVILGGQRSGDPYSGNAIGATSAIYVDHNGKLRVRMVENQQNAFTTSQNRVDDNQYHHVAVTYNSQTQTRTAYLDGEEIGTVTGARDSTRDYQFGTGYVADIANGGANGWLNFTGMIDDPTVYNRVLTQTEIGKIISAGQTGKLFAKASAYPPSQPDGGDGGIVVTAQSGAPPLQFSIDGGNTFAATGTFENLSAGTYNVVIRDNNDARYTLSVVVPRIVVTAERQTPQCRGASTGTLKVLLNGSTPTGNNYRYSINGGTTLQNSNFFTSLAAGEYTPALLEVSTNTLYTGAKIFLSQPLPFSLNPGAFAGAQQNSAYSQTFTLSGNTAPYTITAQGADSGNNYALPAGLTATAGSNSITISGTPTVAGTFPIQILYKDQNSCQDTKTMNLTIAPSANNLSIGGRVTNGGQGLANVTIYRQSGSTEVSTVTDAAGNYSFGNLPPNSSQTVRAALNGYSFTPAPRSYTMTANVADANFATQTTTYEGDAASRPAGDGAVDVLDLVAVGRIISGFDPNPATGGEWQRIDVAPRNTLGDGLIDVLDLVQIGLYSGSLSPRTPAGGAISAANPSSASFASESESAVNGGKSFLGNSFGDKRDLLSKPGADTSAMPPGEASVSADSVTANGTGAVVPIRLNSSGDVQAIQFTVNYDPAKLAVASLNDVQNRFANTTFVLNNTPGKLSVIAYQPLDGASVFPSGSIQLFSINFSPVNNPNGTTGVSFGDDPTARRGSTPQATSVTVSSTAGTIAFLGPTASSVTVSGRVSTPTGRGLTNATVTITGADGVARSARSSSFGHFRFDGIAAGETYVITVVSKRYNFVPQVVTVNESVSGLNFTAQ